MTSRSAGPRKDGRTGTWNFVADLGPGPDGKRRQARRRGFPTKRAAQAELDRLRVRVHEGTVIEPTKVTVGGYLDGWLEALPNVGRAPATVASYCWLVGKHVRPHVGGLKLQGLQPGHLDALYARLLASGLSPRTVRYAHTVVRKALADAQRKGLVVRNVADLADPPSAKAARAPEMAFWTPAELSRFLGFVADDDLYPLLRVAATTGLRRGEVCGLRWADVDHEAGRITVRRQLGVVNGKLAFSERTKSDHGRRSIDLGPKTVHVLRAHRRRQLEARLAMGAGYTDHDLVFASVDGSPLHPEAVAKRFDRLERVAGVPRIRFHDLRHTHCAHLIAAGRNPREISRRLGHASPSFTLDRYGHLMPEADAQAAAAVEILVDGDGGTGNTFGSVPS
jgi:integrase